MRRIGLTGGIGSGKSTAARLLVALGAHLVDADAIAREVVAPGTEGLERLAAEFGPGILAPDGFLDRPALASVVFGDEAARARLNSILHPLIGSRTAELVQGFEDDDPSGVLVHDVPLLVEVGMAAAFDKVVVVQAPRSLRLSRLVDRGVPLGEAEKRMAAQATDEERAAVADVVLDNSGDLEHLSAQVSEVWPVLRG